jgi:hypothetical protein
VPNGAHRRKRRRRGSGRSQIRDAGTLTAWRLFPREEWNETDGLTLYCPEGCMVLVASVEHRGQRHHLAHPFALDDCAHCACDHLSERVNELVAELRGCPVSELRTTSLGMVPHGLTCGVWLSQVRRPAASTGRTIGDRG